MVTAVEGSLLALLLAVGAACAVSDMRRGVVPNRWLGWAALTAALLQAVYGWLLARPYAAAWLCGMALADGLAVLMYAAGLWAAGDAKLFMALYLCVPGRLLDGLGLSAAVIPYMYIFIPAMLLIAADTVWQAARGAERHGRLRFDWRQVWRMLVVAVEVSAVQALLGWIAPEFIRDNGLFCSALMLVYALACSESTVMKRPAVVLLHAAGWLAAALMGGWQGGFAPLWVYAAALMTMAFVRLASLYNYRRVPTAQVQAGMILSAATVLLFAPSRIHGLPDDASEGMRARLTGEQAEAVRRWGVSAKGQETVIIVRKLPFAMLIAVGFALWMAMRLKG